MRAALCTLAALVTAACSSGSVPFCCAPAANVTPANVTPISSPHVLFGALPNPVRAGGVDDGTKYVRALPDFKTLTGTLPNPVHIIVNFGDAFPLESVQAIAAQGLTPFITVQCDQSASLSAVVGGKDDAYYRKFLGAAAAYGKPIYLRPFHEMNNADSHSCGTQGQGALFVQAWRRLHAMTAANIKWIWCPSVPVVAVATDPYYPGDDVVDVIAGDHYANAPDGTYTGPVSAGPFPAFFAHYASHGKPMWIAETAATQPYQANYITSIGAALPNMPGVSAVVWWDAPGGSQASHAGFAWDLGSAGAAAWKALAAHG